MLEKARKEAAEYKRAAEEQTEALNELRKVAMKERKAAEENAKRVAELRASAGDRSDDAILSRLDNIEKFIHKVEARMCKCAYTDSVQK